MDVGELAETEAIATRGICVAVDDDASVVTGHLEQFAHLLIQLEVSDIAPVLRRSLGRQL